MVQHSYIVWHCREQQAVPAQFSPQIRSLVVKNDIELRIKPNTNTFSYTGILLLKSQVIAVPLILQYMSNSNAARHKDCPLKGVESFVI